MLRRLSKSLAALALAALLASSVQGMFMRPTQAPIDRLITNTEAYIKEKPQDATGYYILARIHYLAFSRKVDTVGTFGEASDKSLPQLASDPMQDAGGKGGGIDAPSKELTQEELTAHAKAAAENYQKAIDLDPKNATYHLGLASLLESAAGDPAIALAPTPVPDGLTPPDQPELYKALRATTYQERTAAADKLRAALPQAAFYLVRQYGVETDPEAKNILAALIGDASRITALREYAAAFDLASAKDLQIRNKPVSGLDSLVSYEAATRYAELAKALPNSAVKDELSKMADAKKQLDGKPMGPITPVIFSLEPNKQFADLTAPEITTTFDLDGTNRGFAWSWVKPNTAILAWDPHHTGKITSGWQLFGNVTFNMLWPDGYRALDALDDNRDGILSGDELTGLVLWYDKNANGIADPGEVIPIEKTAIKSIKVHPDLPTSGNPTAIPTATKGLQLRDGKYLPTWDWMVSPK